jgi:hypothetical protein
MTPQLRYSAAFYIFLFSCMSLTLLRGNAISMTTHKPPKSISFIAREKIIAKQCKSSDMITTNSSSMRLSTFHIVEKSRNVTFLPSTTDTNSIRMSPIFDGILILLFGILTSTFVLHVEPVQAKSFSQNARNLERLSAGDASGGSVYDNMPNNDAAKKRRALTGCKITSTRHEASLILSMKQILSEKECNKLILQGDTDFMLQAIRNLECSTCPYGINPDRSNPIRI